MNEVRRHDAGWLSVRPPTIGLRRKTATLSAMFEGRFAFLDLNAAPQALMVRAFMRVAREGVSNHEGSRALDIQAGHTLRSLVLRDASASDEAEAPQDEGAFGSTSIQLAWPNAEALP